MRLMQAKELLRSLVQEYFPRCTVVFANQSRIAKQKQPLVLISPGNVRRIDSLNCYTVDGERVAAYLTRLSVTIDLFSNGSPVIDDETGQTVAYEDDALDCLLSVADFLNSEWTISWAHEHDVAINLDGDVQNLTGIVNDNNYEYRARMSLMFYFTQEAVGPTAVLSSDSVHFPEPSSPSGTTTVEPEKTESTTGGYVTEYEKKWEQATIIPEFKPTPNGGGSEELAAQPAGFFTEVEIKEETDNE